MQIPVVPGALPSSATRLSDFSYSLPVQGAKSHFGWDARKAARCCFAICRQHSRIKSLAWCIREEKVHAVEGGGYFQLYCLKQKIWSGSLESHIAETVKWQ